MSDDGFAQMVDELHDLLDRERAALLAGDLEEIGRLFELKEALANRFVAAGEADPGIYGEVQQKVERNQALLTSAMEGIRVVSDRIGELRRVKQGFETYDRDGTRKKVGVARQGKLEKRA